MSKAFRASCSFLLLICPFAFLLLSINAVAEEPPIRVAIVGLVHGHLKTFMPMLAENSSTKLVAIVEPDESLAKAFADKYRLDSKLFYTDIERMFAEQHPDAVLAYTTVADHRKVIEAAARHGVSSMVEKPLCTTMEDALAIRAIARKQHVQVLVNFETSWYASNHEVLAQVGQGKLGDIRKVVAHDGNMGPKVGGVAPEFFAWLTDPVKNGAGALFDFGNYGADLMTVLMHGQAPVSVTAVAQTDHPENFPKVDDDATIILRYPQTQAVLMPSWNWPFSFKDMEVYGTAGYAITVGADRLRLRYHGEPAESQITAPPVAKAQSSSLDYLAAVVHHQLNPDGDLSCLDTNVVVMQILDAARRSSQTGKTVAIAPLPK